MANLSSRTIFELRLRLCTQIANAPLRTLEQITIPRLLAHFTDDIGIVSEAMVQIPVLIINLSIIGSALVYLGWLSWKLLLLLVFAMVLGIGGYRAPVSTSTNYFRRAREQWNHLFKGFQGLTLGIKELKLHEQRRERFYEEKLVAPADDIRRLGLRGYTILAAANSWGQIVFFALLGVLLFGATRTSTIGTRVITGYALTLLFIISPLEVILSMFPVLSRARIASQQLEQIMKILPDSNRVEAKPIAAKPEWQEIRLCGISHGFRTEADEGFVLGPLDLTLRRAEIVFIVGGNGSGKTTLAKLLAGLYIPERGSVYWDNVPVDKQNIVDYRQLFSAVFSDFYLFDSMLGIERPELDEEARKHLEMLQLSTKVSIKNGTLSTIELSQGQKKRLALLTAYLEDRAIYIFDEWAADQEPGFREIFYRHLLPLLREKSKTAVVISHDDRYFDVADRVIEMEYGQIRRTREPWVEASPIASSRGSIQ